MYYKKIILLVPYTIIILFIAYGVYFLNKVYGIGPKKLEEIKDIQHHIIYVINRLEIRKDLEEREDKRNGRRK